MKCNAINYTAALVATMTLAACGGGGGGGGGGGSAPPPVTNSPPAQTTIASAQGLYGGSLTPANDDLSGLVLEDGTYYFVYSRSGVVIGLVQGTAAGNNGSFASTNAIDFNLAADSRTAALVSGTYSPKSAFNGSSTEGGVTSNFQTTYDASYDTPATLAAVAGTYAGATTTVRGSNPVSYTISSTGALTGSSTFSGGTCTFTGTLAPRASGKNVYDLSVTFGAGNCALPSQTVTGVAVPATVGTAKSLFAIGLLPDRSNGFLVLATKS